MKARVCQMVGVAVGALLLAVGGYWFSQVRAARQNEAARQARQAHFERFGIPSDGVCAFHPLPPFIPYKADYAALGGELFRNKRLTMPANRTCVACHPLNANGRDGRTHGGVLTRSVYNAAFGDVFLTSGACTNLADLVRQMITDAHFGGCTNRRNAASWLNSDIKFAYRYKKTFPEGVTPSNVVVCLTEYLKTLVVANAPFDQFLGGKTKALPEDAQRGSRVFLKQNCLACHDGPTLGAWQTAEGKKVTPLRGLRTRTRYFSDGTRNDLGAVLAFMPGGDVEGAARLDLLAFLREL